MVRYQLESSLAAYSRISKTGFRCKMRLPRQGRVCTGLRFRDADDESVFRVGQEMGRRGKILPSARLSTCKVSGHVPIAVTTGNCLHTQGKY